MSKTTEPTTAEEAAQPEWEVEVMLGTVTVVVQAPDWDAAMQAADHEAFEDALTDALSAGTWSVRPL